MSFRTCARIDGRSIAGGSVGESATRADGSVLCRVSAVPRAEHPAAATAVIAATTHRRDLTPLFGPRTCCGRRAPLSHSMRRGALLTALQTIIAKVYSPEVDFEFNGACSHSKTCAAHLAATPGYKRARTRYCAYPSEVAFKPRLVNGRLSTRSVPGTSGYQRVSSRHGRENARVSRRGVQGTAVRLQHDLAREPQQHRVGEHRKPCLARAGRCRAPDDTCRAPRLQGLGSSRDFVPR